VAGHTLAAYRRLPHGWRTAPADIPTDLHMWRQFLDQPWCRVQTDWRPTSLQFPSPPRRDWTLEQRLAELDEWVNRSRQPAFFAWLTAEVDLRRGQAGHIDASLGVTLLDVYAGGAGPGDGHAHGSGNPHYWLDPKNGEIITANILERLRPRSRACEGL